MTVLLKLFFSFGGILSFFEVNILKKFLANFPLFATLISIELILIGSANSFINLPDLKLHSACANDLKLINNNIIKNEYRITKSFIKLCGYH